MRKQFRYCIDLPHGLYDIEGTAVAEDGALIEFTTPDGNAHEPTRASQRTPDNEILYLIREEIMRTCALKIEGTRKPDRPDIAPVYV